MLANIYTTFALINGRLQSGVIEAIKENSQNASIGTICIVTESDVSGIISKYPLLNNSKIRWEIFSKRPTFGDMLDIINSDFRESKSVLSILLNADIGIPDIKTPLRLHSAMEKLGEDRINTVFSLTRHELIDGKGALALKTGMGFPNVISSDAWVFSSEILCEKSLYYSLGQMYCDKFFNHDLIASGYFLYNPCIDCIVVHHEEEIKDNDYYLMLSDSDASKDSLKKHWKTSVGNNGNYYGVSHIKSLSLSAGYRPRPISFHFSKKKIIIFLDADESSINDFFNRLFESLDYTDLSVELYLVIESNDSYDYIEFVLTKKNITTNVFNTLVESVESIIRRLFDGKHDSFGSILITKEQEVISKNILGYFETIFLDFRKNKTFGNIQLNPDCSPYLPAIDGERIDTDFCVFASKHNWLKEDAFLSNKQPFVNTNLIVFVEYGTKNTVALLSEYYNTQNISFFFGDTGFENNKIDALHDECSDCSILI